MARSRNPLPEPPPPAACRKRNVVWCNRRTRQPPLLIVCPGASLWLAEIVGVRSCQCDGVRAEIVLPVRVIVHRNLEASRRQIALRRFFADEEYLSIGSDAADERSERLAGDQIGLVCGRTGLLEPVGIGSPAIFVPGEADKTLRGYVGARCRRNDNTGIEILDLIAVTQRVDRHR